MPSRNQTSADPINVGDSGTSDPLNRPVSEPVMGRNTNRIEPRKTRTLRQIGSGRSSRQAGGALEPSLIMGSGDESNRQPSGVTAMPDGPNPHGVHADPTAGQGTMPEPENPAVVSHGMAGATGDHDSGGRSLRSSQRTGKPSTWRREAVGAGCRQEADAKASDPVNTEFILDMQRKLYRWSRSDPTQVFDDLFNLVCDRRSLNHAWQMLCRNRGSNTPGVDMLTRRRIEERAGGVEKFLDHIREQLRQGTYTPKPVRQKLIPKPGKPGKFRPLGIPTLADRLVQMALKNVLEPIFEADFYPTSYGFRRGRSTLDALTMAQYQARASRHGPSKIAWVIEGDIKGCFDNIDHHLLMERVRKRIGDRKVLRLVLAFLKAGIMAEGSIRHPVAGTPQGGIVSPLLANVLLTALDERYGRWTPRPAEAPKNAGMRRVDDRKKGRPTFFMVRYADDFVILVCGTREEAEAEKDELAIYLREQLHLELSVEKTLITPLEEGFEFLGYRVVREPALRDGRPVVKLRIPKGKLQTLRDRIRERTCPATTSATLANLLKTLAPLIAGWRNYYRYATGAYDEFSRLDLWMLYRIHRWLRRKHPKATNRELGRRYSRRVSATRRTWGEEAVTLQRFTQNRTATYSWRGFHISNGWNDELDGALRNPDAARPNSAYECLAEELRSPQHDNRRAHGEPDAGKPASPVRREVRGNLPS